LWCDNSKIKRLTGFTPSIDLHEGLRRTIEWFTITENLKRFKVDIYNV
jgi:nucleoside-diphosphate-sugar epimerase